MFPGDRYEHDSTTAINKYKYVKGFLLIAASLAFAVTVFWPSIKSYFKTVSLVGATASLLSTPSSKTKGVVAHETKNSAQDIRFFGTDKSNQPYLLIADKGHENQAGIVFLTKPQLTLTLQSKDIATLNATEGTYDKNKELITLTGDVVITHSAGYEFVTSLAWVDLIQSIAYGDQVVQGEGPNGTIHAKGGFQLLEKGDRIIFLGRPELILKTGKKP